MIIDLILKEGFEISAMEMFYLNRASIEEFYNIYKGVLSENIPLYIFYNIIKVKLQEI